MSSHSNPIAGPVQQSQRHMVLDALRGFALLGVCLANYPEFSLFSFLSTAEQAALPWAGADGVTRWVQLLLVDGKFYTLFSLLFGMGFSIIIANAERKGANGFRIFYRRMALLALIGLGHMMLVWSGDILMLYALLGMILPLFRHCSDRALLYWAAFFLLLPVPIDALRELSGVSLATPAYQLWWSEAARQGITEQNFASWLADARSYADVHAFLMQGAWERLWEFVDGQRYFKVMGLFVLGFYIGRRRLFADLETHRPLFNKIAFHGLLFGLPLSAVYAWSAISSHPWGTTMHTILYTVSVYPLGLAYAAAFCLLFMRCRDARLWRWLAAPGRMALTCYLSQSLLGMLLFYGTGFALGLRFGLLQTELIALLVFAFEIMCCLAWMHWMRFGPFEWVWRMLTYGRLLPLRKSAKE